MHAFCGIYATLQNFTVRPMRRHKLKLFAIIEEMIALKAVTQMFFSLFVVLSLGSGHEVRLKKHSFQLEAAKSWQKKTILKVLTFNVAALGPFGKFTASQTVSRIEELCRQFGESDYDVILLQEVWSQGYRKRFENCGFSHTFHDEQEIGLIKKLKENMDMSLKLKIIARAAQTLFPKDYGFDKGLMILSRYPMTNKQSFTFEINGLAERAFQDGEFPVNKGALLATLEHPYLGNIALVNTHLVSNYPDHNYNDQREQQLHELVTAAEAYALNYPLVIGGDLNMSPPAPEGRPRRNHTDHLWQRLRGSLLREFSQADLPYERLTTYPDRKNPQALTPGVLDHLFMRDNPTLLALSGGVVFKEKISCGKEACYASDHYGVETVFGKPLVQTDKDSIVLR